MKANLYVQKAVRQNRHTMAAQAAADAAKVIAARVQQENSDQKKEDFKNGMQVWIRKNKRRMMHPRKNLIYSVAESETMVKDIVQVTVPIDKDSNKCSLTTQNANKVPRTIGSSN